MRGWRQLWCLVPLLVASPALAQGGGQTDDELAKEYYGLGEKLYNRSDYDGALKQFQKAYEHSKRPALYYNMARCYEFLGKLEQAIEHYETFLASKPKNEPEVRARIANLQKRLEADRPAPIPVTQTPPGSGTKPEPVKPPPPVEQPPPPRQERSRWMRTLGWVSAGAGGAILVTSAIFGAMAGKRSQEINDAAVAGKEWRDYESTWQEGENLENAQIVSLVVGAAALAGGALLIYLDHRAESQQRQAWIAPSAAPGGALVGGGFRF